MAIALDLHTAYENLEAAGYPVTEDLEAMPEPSTTGSPTAPTEITPARSSMAGPG